MPDDEHQQAVDAVIEAARKVLKSRIIGRGYKLKREALEAWAKKL